MGSVTEKGPINASSLSEVLRQMKLDWGASLLLESVAERMNRETQQRLWHFPDTDRRLPLM